jgi:hypothetical protein
VHLAFEVLTVVTTKSAIFWDVTPFSMVEDSIFRCQGIIQNKQQHEASSKQSEPRVENSVQIQVWKVTLRKPIGANRIVPSAGSHCGYRHIRVTEEQMEAVCSSLTMVITY